MQIYFFWGASIVSFITFAVHTFIGGPRVAKPLLACPEIPRVSRWLSYGCWHMATIFIFSMACAFAYLAHNPGCPELALFLTVVSFAISILSASLALKADIHPFRFPSTVLFALISLLGLLGLLYD